jgi:UDP-2-acetamido-2-deoxy-ribo-hexuluronate aminotransferase
VQLTIFAKVSISPNHRMNRIAMVDLRGQYRKIKPEIDAAIGGVIDSTAFIKGPDVKAFEDELSRYLGIKHVIACANGTDALQISLMALGLQPGDEVITPAFTFISTVEVAALLGLKPVIADVDPRTFNLDPVSVKKAITTKTRAIIPVHLFGQCAPMDEITGIASEYQLVVIEDVAQALSAVYTHNNGQTVKAGTLGRIGCTSFFPTKSLGCFGDGGAIFTNDDTLAAQMSAITHHGMRIRYHYEMTGVNSRLDTLQAAILRVKLKYLDEYSAARNRVADWYDRELASLPGILIPQRVPFSTHVFHQYTLRLQGIDREELRKHLDARGIPSMVYYPVPAHLQKAFRNLGYREGDFPVSEELCRTVLSIPMHTELDEEQLQHITDCIAEFVKR